MNLHDYFFVVAISETYGNNAYGYCEAGISAQFTADGYDVIMGIVGAIRLKGEHEVPCIPHF